MHLNRNSDLKDRHARLSASNYSWVNYDEEQMVNSFFTWEAAARGTRRHALAHDLIREREKLPDVPKTLNMYVNDCIGWQMTPEQPLRPFPNSDNAFGTADALSFRENVLRISDYKSGVTPCKITQLEVYAAYFCLEYQMKPFELDAIELRIYQNDEIAEYKGDPVAIMLIINKAVAFNNLINKLREETSR